MTGLGQLQEQEGRSMWHFPSILCFCELTQACIRARFPQSHKEILSPLLTLAIPESQTKGTSSRLSDFCWLLCSLLLTGLFSSADSSVRSTSLVASFSWLWNLPFLVLFRSRGKFRAQAPCVGFTPKKTKECSEWHLPTPTETNTTNRVPLSSN